MKTRSVVLLVVWALLGSACEQSGSRKPAEVAVTHVVDETGNGADGLEALRTRSEQARTGGSVSIKAVHDRREQKQLNPAERNKLKDLVRAIRYGEVQPIKDHLRSGGDPDFGEKGNTLLMEAAYNKQLAVVRVLIEGGADVNADNGAGDSPLSFAMDKPMFSRTPVPDDPRVIHQIVGSLLAAGAQVKIPPEVAAKRSTPLHAAAKSGDLALMRLFLEKGAEVEAYGRYDATPLTEAINKGRLSAVKLLLRSGAKAKPADPSRGQVPLIQAVSQGSIELSMYLYQTKKAGNEPNEVEIKKMESKWFGLIDTLVTAGAELGAKDDRGNPVLFTAINGGYPPMLKKVLSKKAKLTSRNEKGESALHYLAGLHRLKEPDLIPLAKILIERGAKKKEKSPEGKTASQIAKGRGFDKLALVLR